MNTIDLYIANIKNTQERLALENLRKILHEIIPGATECISYGIPTLKLGKEGVAGFAALKNHLSFYPFSGSIFEHFSDELEGWEYTKSSLHFTVEKPIPRDLLEKIMQKRLEK